MPAHKLMTCEGKAFLAFMLAISTLHTSAFGMDEAEWLIEVSGLEPEERAERVQNALATFDRERCGLLIGALLSQDEEIELLVPRIQRHVRLLVRSEDVEYLLRKSAEVKDTQRRDWLIDLLGFCGTAGFAKLRRLHQQTADPSIKIGAFRAMGNLLDAEALEYVEASLGESLNASEREAGLFAKSRLQWRLGVNKANADYRRKPLTRLKDGLDKIRSALSEGGSFIVGPSDLERGAQDILMKLGVEAPTGALKLAPQHCTLDVKNFHRFAAYPFDFFMADVAARSHADFGWKQWNEKQIAPLRLAERSELAAVVIQEGVLGKGRVVFSGMSMHSIQSAARLGIGDRDPWDENLGWFHGNRDPGHFLEIWQAKRGFVSQHVPYGKPLPGGAIKAAFITPNFGSRDAIEIEQRLDLEWHHFPFQWSKQRGFGHGTEVGRLKPACFEIIERVFEASPNVIIFSSKGKPSVKGGTLTWSLLPEGWKQAVLQNCRDKGIGVVVLGDSGPLDRMPQDDNQEFINTPFGEVKRAQWGKARFVSMRRPGSTPPMDISVPGAFGKRTKINYLDYWFAEVAKHVAWAAGREMPVEVTPQPVVADEGLMVTLKNVSDREVSCLVNISLRNLYGTVSARGSSPTKVQSGAEKTVKVALDTSPTGNCFAEILVRNDKGQSLGWNSFYLKVNAETNIEDIEFDQPMYQPGDEMTLKFIMEGTVPDGVQTRLKILDHYNRLCGQTEQQLSDNRTARIRIRQPLWRYVTLRAELFHNGKRITEFEKPFIVDVPRPTNDFPYAAWSYVGREPSLYPMTHAARINWLNMTYEPSLENGLLPWVLNFGGLGLGYHAPAMNYERNRCTLGPTFHQWRLNAIPPKVPGMIRAGVPAIIDQDEEGLGGEYGFHPASLREFRKHMKVVHRSLNRLNEVWQTEFKSWDEVMPMRKDQLKGRDSLSPMVDLRMFMDTAYLHHVEFDRFVAESSGMRDVKLGLSTSGGGFSDGWDIWKASQMLTCMIRQHTGNREKWRSWQRPDSVIGRWAGGYYPDDVLSNRFMPWHQLFHESTIYATWGAGIGDDMSIWRSDANPRVGIAAAAVELEEIQSGPATLLRHSRRVPPQIGIHYSRASQMTSHVEWQSAAWGSASVIQNVAEMLGHQYRWISYEELEQGFCNDWPGKALFLPVSTCLSKHEVEAIRRYVQKGGTIIADCDAGTRDRHGGPVGKGQLADVFGCEWIPAPPLQEGEKVRAILELDGLPEVVEVNHSFRRIAKLTTGKPRGSIKYGRKEFPAWIKNSFGKGKAITLNFLLGRSTQTESIIEAALAQAGVAQEVEVLKDGTNLAGVERFNFHDGAVRYTGVIQFVRVRSHWGSLELTEEEATMVTPVLVKFPMKRHLYDVRTKKYMGETDRLDIELRPGLAHMFAHMPYKVKDIEMRLAGPGRAGSSISIGVRILPLKGNASSHSIQFKVTDPAGKERREYGGVVYAKDGTGELKIPLASNDPIGEWSVVAVDTVSGAKAKVAMEVTR